MKKKLLFTMMIGAAIMMGFGITGTQKDVVKADAEVIATQTKRIHFFGNTDASVWGAAGEVMKVNYTSNSIETTSVMNLDYTSPGSATTTYMWYFDLPNDVATFTFSRYSSEDVELEESAVATYSATSIMFMVNDSDNSLLLKSDKPTEFLYPSPDTMRVFVTNYNGSWYGSAGYPLTLRVNDNKHYYLNAIDINGTQSGDIFYCDIPVGSAWKVFSLYVTAATPFNTKSSTAAINSNHYKIYNIPTTTKGADAPIDAAPTNIDQDLFAKVLEGYTTCSDSAINGYGAWANLDSYWYDNLVSTDLTGLTLLDHDVTDIEAGVYKDNVYKTTSVSVQEKWDMMESMYETLLGAPQAIISNHNKDSLLVTVLTAVGALSFFAAFYFKSRRRRYN
ncbi:MAG: hypothetical protein WC399_03935 [Bacilli bacterium]|jgi:hypothetical protein